MDFVFDNLVWLIAAAAGLVQWWKSTQDAKAERNREAEEYPPGEIDEMIGRSERSYPRPAVPPPVPHAAPAPPPALRRSAPEPSYRSQGNADELERQVRLADQVKLLKRAKQQRSPDASPVFGSIRKRPVESLGTLRGRLQNRRELRQAFVLKEILEKPVGLR